MSYNVDELFSFWKYNDGYGVYEYLNKFDPTITELEFPSEYKGEPVTSIIEIGIGGVNYIKRVVIPPSVRVIEDEAFCDFSALESVELSEGLEVIGSKAFAYTGLKSIVLPKSLKELGGEAFYCCGKLESVIFNSSPSFGKEVFSGCFRLPPETIATSVVRSTDITRPVFVDDYQDILEFINLPGGCFLPQVFDLLAKNNCFRSCNLRNLLMQMIKNNEPKLFPVAEQYGMLSNAELVEELISYSTERKSVELTAYLLDLKNRKFGFNGGGAYEL